MSPATGITRWFGERTRRKQRRPGARRSRALGIETLDARLLLSTTPVTFQIPPDVAARGVWLSVFGQLTAGYTPSTGPALNSGTFVYYDSAINDYAAATTTSTLTFQLTGSSFNLPDAYAKGGQIVIGVGSAPIVTYNSGSGFATPTAATNPTNYFGLFEFTNDATGIDIDISEVDQLGFPFTVYTSSAPFPAQGGIGMARTRAKVFNFYGEYIGALPSDAQVFQQSLTYGAPYRILAPQNILEAQEAVKVTGAAPQTGGSVPLGSWYYWVTATNSNGETGAGQYTLASVTGQNNAVYVTWNAMWGATGYKVYRGSSTDPTQASLVGTVTSASQLYLLDKVQQGSAGTPPRNSYTLNPLNSYFDSAIDAFFRHYETGGTQFVMDRDGSTFTGYTNTAYSYQSNTYTVLDLSASSGPYAGQHFLIFKPHFLENTNDNSAPPAPSWMPHKTQSPGAMIMADDGVFNTGGAQPGVDAGVLSDIENSISSAFNRGIADNFAITPNNWAFTAPTMSAPAAAVSGGSLDIGKTYYYVVTAVDANSNESTISLEVKATTSSGNQSIQLSWLASTSPISYNIYRSETPGTGYKLIYTLPNPAAPPATGYTDAGTTHHVDQTPPTYYASGSTPNWYAGFFHENSTTDTVSGVSINGLAYGFSYDDQGNNSSNFKVSWPANVIVTLQPWVNLSSSATTVQSLSGKPVPPTQPSSIMLLTEPSTNRAGTTTTLSFEVFTAYGHPFFGGATVTVVIAGVGRRTFTVQSDAATGIGTITFDNRSIGYHMVEATIQSGREADSDVFQTVAKSTSNRIISALDAANRKLNTDAFRSYLRRIR